MINVDSSYRLRASVALVPEVTPSGVVCDFFLGNTRRTRRFLVRPEFYEAVRTLDGSETLKQEAIRLGLEKRAWISFVEALTEACILEPCDLGMRLDSLPNRRTAHFLQDYFPNDEVIAAMDRMADAKVMIVGAGAVGSWTGELLARFGIGHLTFVDFDTVEISNLNRSLFSFDNVGHLKGDSIVRRLAETIPSCQSEWMEHEITSAEDFADVLRQSSTMRQVDLVINCADHPNVDETSRWIASSCMPQAIPHIIAGGYNLHLSLVGPTIIPFQTPCISCIGVGLAERKEEGFEGVVKLSRPGRRIGSLGPLAAIGSTFVANEALRTILRGARMSPRMTGARAEMNFLTGEMNRIEFTRRGDCEMCGEGRDIMPTLSVPST